MSFFNDFLNYFKINDISNKIAVSMVVGVGICVIGNFKVKSLSDCEIIFVINKDLFIIKGDGLKIATISKGEVVVAGDVKSLELVKK